MPKYEVTICKTVITTTKVEISARDEEEASIKAEKYVEEHYEKCEWELESDELEVESVDDI